MASLDSGARASPARTLVAFSRGRWSVAQRRPHELLSRLAGRWHVVFAQAPRGIDTPPARLARRFDQLGLAGSIAWIDTPDALPLLDALRPGGVVFDCQDDPQGDAATAEAIRRADLLLATGPALYRSLYGRHPNLHCVPHAVEAERFAPAQLRHDGAEARAAAALHLNLAGPRLGYFGVIDERIDFALLEALADAHPGWQIVMVGPCVGIDPSRLPRRQKNLHWLGVQPYARLPYLLNGWDIALLPFVIDAHTRFLNPVEALEYLAGETPVVGTSLRDVVALYGDAVEVAASHADFIGRCEKVLSETAARRARREAEMMSVVWTASWQRTADSVHALLERRWPVENEAVPPITFRAPPGVTASAVAAVG